jgi:prepilin-type processing-associated H-X9-DG protein
MTFYRSEVRGRNIKDGTSKTYFAAEKYTSIRGYDFSVLDFGENQSAYTGFEWDMTRLAFYNPASPPNVNAEYAPRRDGFALNYSAFGSVHSSGFNAVFCDGSVTSVTYDIDREVHRRFGSREDGQHVSAADI